MAINEVFPNPTVKGVHFEMRFPNLFYLERRIGDFQTEIMKEFPESKLVIRRQFLLADLGPNSTIEDRPEQVDQEALRKIWTFKSKAGVVLNVLTDSLQIHSESHKTYDNPNCDERFRDVIASVVPSFLKITAIPVITRVGLRYIDECPIVKKDNETFSEWYKTAFPLDRFDISDATEMVFRATVQKNGYFLRYIEALVSNGDKHSLTLDFDGFAKEVEPEKYLAVADRLHTLISAEFEASVKAPVFEYMRTRKEEKV